jgi:carbon storage regulator
MLILARRIGESIMIGDQVEISVVDIKGDQVKLGINAPTQVKVYRKEVYAAIQQENRAAAAAAPESLPHLEGLLGTKTPAQRPPDAPQRPPDAPQRPTDAPTGRDPKAR